MKKYHPDTCAGDKAQAEAKTKDVNAAYAVLKDPRKRAVYDARRQRRADKISNARSKRSGAARANSDVAQDDLERLFADRALVRSAIIMTLFLLALLVAIGLGVHHH
jgi:curved DNA-binding protein CbpA